MQLVAILNPILVFGHLFFQKYSHPNFFSYSDRYQSIKVLKQILAKKNVLSQFALYMFQKRF